MFARLLLVAGLLLVWLIALMPLKLVALAKAPSAARGTEAAPPGSPLKPTSSEDVAVDMPPSPEPEAPAKAVPDSAVLLIEGANDYEAQRHSFGFHTFQSKTEIVHLGQKVRTECNKVLELSLFTTCLKGSASWRMYSVPRTQTSTERSPRRKAASMVRCAASSYGTNWPPSMTAVVSPSRRSRPGSTATPSTKPRLS